MADPIYCKFLKYIEVKEELDFALHKAQCDMDIFKKVAIESLKEQITSKTEEEQKNLLKKLYWSSRTMRHIVLEVYSQCHLNFNVGSWNLEASCFLCLNSFNKTFLSWEEYETSTAMCAACLEKENQINEKLEEEMNKDEDTWQETTEKEIKTLRWMPYAQYLKTEHWQRIRKKCLKRANHKCALCPANSKNSILDVHHRTYENRGCEKWKEDCIVLCRACHDRHHNILAKEGGEK